MQLKFSFPSDRDDRFAALVIDHNNRRTVEICRAFAEGKPGQPRSLTLYGPAGSGKTHLLSAMGKVAAEISRNETALYLDGGRLAETVGANPVYEDLKRRLAAFEAATFLAVDRLEAVEGDRRAEDQVFHLYNAVTEAGGRFAAAARTPPGAWRFADWLSSRLLWGHALEVAPVGDDGRVAVLQKMAADLRLHLPERAAVWLINHLPRDPQTQMNAIGLIDRRSLTTGRKVSIPLIKKALERINAG